MFTIMKRRELNPTVTELWIKAPLIAKKAKAGQFIIVRAKEDSERIPLTIADFDREAGTVSIIFQVVGAGTIITRRGTQAFIRIFGPEYRFGHAVSPAAGNTHDGDAPHARRRSNGRDGPILLHQSPHAPFFSNSFYCSTNVQIPQENPTMPIIVDFVLI